MQLALDSGDRKLLIGAAAIVLALALTAALAGTEGPRASIYPSSYSAASDGAKAAFLTLQNLGYKTERWLDPPLQLKPQDSLLILADPTIIPTKDERRALRKYVESGGRSWPPGSGQTCFYPTRRWAGTTSSPWSGKNFPPCFPAHLRATPAA